MVILTIGRNKDNNSYGYTKMEKEDLEERKRREAQFLIYKTLKQVDQMVGKSSSTKPSWLRLRICKLKVRIGKRLMKLRKISIFSTNTTTTTKFGVCKHFVCHLKNLRRLFLGGGSGGRGGGATTGRLPQPLYT